MKRTGKKWSAGVMLGGWLLAGSPSGAVQLVKQDQTEINLRGRMQLFGVGEALQDDYRNDSRVYLFMRQARLGFFGALDRNRFNVEMAFAGEEGVITGTPGYALGLMDFSVDLFLMEQTYVKVGQFKVPSTLEEMTGDGSLLFPERSINYLASRMGRDAGAALMTSSGEFKLIAGLLTGGGRDVPERYLPQVLGIPMVAFRAGWDTTAEDPFMRTQEAGDLKDSRSSFYVNGLYLRDSLVGHSTVLNVKTSDRSLLMNLNWNPYVGRTPLAQGSFFQVGADLAHKTPLAGGVWMTELEANLGRYDHPTGGLQIVGGRAQTALAMDAWTMGLRYAVIIPDGNMYKGAVQIADTRPIHQLTPTVAYKASPFVKVITSLDVLADVPVITEKNLGAYVSMEQPDQTGSGPITRQNVYEAKVLIQVSF